MIAKLNAITINIFFPRVPKDIEQASHMFGSDVQELFVNDVLLPCLNQMDVSDMYPEPLSFAGAAHFGIGKTSLRLESSLFCRLVDHIKALVNQTTDSRLWQFRHLFLILYSHGLKKMIPRGQLEAGNLVSFGLENLGLAHNYLVHSNLYLDLAISCRPPRCSGLTGLWCNHMALLSGLLEESISNSRYRLDNFCQFFGVGSFRYLPSSPSFVSIQAYGTWKHCFFSRVSSLDRQGKDVSSGDVFNQTKTFKNWVARMEESLAHIGTRTYAARFEVRLRYSTYPVDQILDFLPALVPHIRWVKTEDLFGFVRFRLQALCTVATSVLVDGNKCTTSSLTAAAVLAFCLDSLVHREPDSGEWRSVIKLIREHRHGDSDFPFLSSLFGSRSDRYVVSSPLDRGQLSRLFPLSMVNASSDPTIAPSPSTGTDITSQIPILLAAQYHVDTVSSNPFFNLDIHPTIRANLNFSTAESHLQWCIAQSMFLMYSIDNRILVELFCQLLLNEVASKVSTWPTIGTELIQSVDTASSMEYRFFFDDGINNYLAK